MLREFKNCRRSRVAPPLPLALLGAIFSSRPLCKISPYFLQANWVLEPYNSPVEADTVGFPLPADYPEIHDPDELDSIVWEVFARRSPANQSCLNVAPVKFHDMAASENLKQLPTEVLSYLLCFLPTCLATLSRHQMGQNILDTLICSHAAVFHRRQYSDQNWI